MKKQAINFSWPAQLSDFAKDTVQENFSRGRLKVFYKGETADHRFFSDSFSEEIIKSLPYTPVVSYYDEEKEDFVGHATEQQVLGIVDPCIEPSFEEDEEGKVWCVCDVVLYTERPDRVGDLAKKIVGHKQSLELDPSSVQYKINYDEKKHFKNIEFTAGKFVGVSVLGNDQKPAFTGSAFFACDENFESKMKILREYCEKQNDHEEEQGGNEMNLQEFMKLSWGEVSDKVAQAVAKEYQNDAYCYVVDMFEDAAICRFYYYMENGSKLMKIKYTCDDNGNVCLGDIVEVRVTYEEVVEVSNIATAIELEKVGVENATEVEEDEEKDEVVVDEDFQEEEKEDEESQKAERPVDEKEEEFADDSKEEEEEEVTEESSEKEEEEEFTNESEEEEEEDKVVCAACGDEVDEEEEKSTATDAADVSNAEVTQTERVVDGNEQVSEETNTSSASFTQSERAEFEALKREKKVNLLNSYKETLSEEDFDKFLGSIDSFEEKDLEIELLKAYKASQEKEPKKQRAFAFAPILNQKNAEKNSLDDFIRSNL